MHDFTTSDPEQIIIPALKKRMKEVKHIGEDGRSYMCKVVDELIDERVTEAEEKKSKEIALRMHADGLDDDHIARYTDTPVEQVKAWLY